MAEERASVSGDSSATRRQRVNVTEDDIEYEETKIEWINLIFLPFNPIFRFTVLISVILKVAIGPLDGVYGISSNCKNLMDYHIVTKIIRYVYKYPAAIVYFIDTFLHIIHRQVTDKALRREYLPKSAFLIVLDVLAMIPFDDLLLDDPCKMAMWPNMLSFLEFLIVYRICQYFELVRTHIYWKLYIGYTLLILVSVNFMTCLLLLITFEGLCANCPSVWTPGSNSVMYDWRAFFVQPNHTLADYHFNIYFHGFSYITSYIVNIAFHTTRPLTIAEYALACVFMYLGYMVEQLIIFPKFFAESALTLRRICSYHPNCKKILNDIKSRNPDPAAHDTVENFYNLMWKQRMGITLQPKMITTLPRYLRIDISEDLTWQIFYHSPTFRKTSLPFKRYLCGLVRSDYKLPGEKFFSGPHSQTHLYYLKSGIVQMMSDDDGSSALISVTGGTLFGDLSFYIPPLQREKTVKCLTYCEVLVIPRGDLLKSLHRYPEDRKEVYRLANNKVQHAKSLYECKLHLKGVDRAEDEGIDWVKKRWWEISDYIDQYKAKSKLAFNKCELPPEETPYHCAKYIGQLVLCNDAQLKQSSLFINDSFPWVLSPHSIFNRIWHNFVLVIVIFVLLYFPPNITSHNISDTFIKLKYFVDFVYVSDIIVSLLTAIDGEQHSTSDFASVMLVRFKKPAFVMDILATVWIEEIPRMIGKPEYYYVCVFNRLIKIYMLFPKVGINWKIGQDHMLPVYLRIFFIYFSYSYIIAFIVYLLIRYTSFLSPFYFYGPSICAKPNLTEHECLLSQESTRIALNFLLNFIYNQILAKGPHDIALKMFIAYNAHLIFKYCKATFVASIYLRYRDLLDYQKFVSTVKNYYEHHEIHPSLMGRLNRYMDCHWKYHYGVDVLNPNVWKDEPFDIFWKAQGQIAEKIMRESMILQSADPAAIKELAYVAKFLLMPQNATLFILGVTCKHITWVVQGEVTVEFYDDDGEMVKKYFGPGHMLSIAPALLGRPSLRTYMCATDCEILYVSVTDFLNIMRRHPHEYEYLTRTINTFTPQFDEAYDDYVRKHAEYHRKLRERLYQGMAKIIQQAQPHPELKKTFRKKRRLQAVETELFVNPESGFIKYWMPFRAFIVFVSIVAASLQGIGAFLKWYLSFIETLCNAIAMVDMTMKFFLAYYNDKGIMVTKKLNTAAHYLTHTFMIDLIGALPWGTLISHFSQEIPQGVARLINTLSEFGPAYILLGYFNFLADKPSAISAIIKIAKWQILTLLIMLGGSHFLINLCLDYTYKPNGKLLNITRLDTCWMPYYLEVDKNPKFKDLHMIFAQSINLAQSGLLNVNHAEFNVSKAGQTMVALILVILAIIYWYVIAYSVTIMVLVSRSDTLFQHNIHQLRMFLQSERVEPALINNTVDHFSYWRLRTKGINLRALMKDRVGIVLRQDITYFFYRSTFAALNTIMEGGEQFQRDMASASTLMYFLPNAQIMREMDLCPTVFVVHKGRVIVMQNEKKMAVLTKGSIFGQLTGTAPRPVKVTAIADRHCDILKISLKEFNEIINAEVKDSIQNNSQAKNDFMVVIKIEPEIPRNSIAYILRGRKSIKLPWMLTPTAADKCSWYVKWLYLAWLLGPLVTAYITMFLIILPHDIAVQTMWSLLAFDVIHFVHIITEYYTLETAIVGNKCIKRKVGFRLFKDWMLYVNLISLVVPMVTFFNGNMAYTLARVARLLLFCDFYKQFCTSEGKLAPFLLKSLSLLLLMHYMACGWIYVACRGEFPIKQPTAPEDIPKANATIDHNEWMPAEKRFGGCNRPTFFNYFVVPKHWWGDYIVAITFIIVMHTGTILGNNMQMTVTQVYYKVFINIIIYLVDIWLISVAIGFVYTRLRDFYHYDYDVKNMKIYLRHSGLAPSLLRSVTEYTTHLWRRQRGNWMPELTMRAPTCLREDLFGALYLHHILTPPLFKELPEYFTRQLVARAKRIVIFPGKCIIQEGDIFSVMYFIHEGEVEKWWNYNSPDKKLASLLTTNGYFGFFPGLFPNTRFQFTYASRTVVDLIYLDLAHWQDLLIAYPDVKTQLYKGAMRMKVDYKN